MTAAASVSSPQSRNVHGQFASVFSPRPIRGHDARKPVRFQTGTVSQTFREPPRQNDSSRVHRAVLPKSISRSRRQPARTSNLTVLSKARVTPYQANFFRPRCDRGSDAESPRKSLIRRPRSVHDQSGEMTRGSRFDCVAAAVASISCSPLHPAALQIDPPAAAGILPLGFRRVNLWRHRTNPSCARRTPSPGDAVTESG